VDGNHPEHPEARRSLLPSEDDMNGVQAIAISLCTAALACGGSQAAQNPSATSGSSAVLEKPAEPRLLAAFDPAAGELPEGLATKSDVAFVGFAPLGEITRVDLRTGESTRFAKLPKPVPGKGFMTGLAFGPDGVLYAALVSFDPSVQPGIYRVPTAGGQATLFAKAPGMLFPNGLVFDAKGVLFVTDSAAGAVYKVSPSGDATVWASSPLLAGDAKECGGSGNPFPIGANGIVARDGAFYVTNTDKGLVLRVASMPDGLARTPEVVAGPDCGALAGSDGLVVDRGGDLVIAVNRQNKLVRLASGGRVEVISQNGALDFPASLTRDTSALFVTNFALANASSGKPAHPGLLRIPDAP
jgi:sugar lactone lactonase YvrE